MALTPMMQQYFEIKEVYKEYIIFFRLGDFYEMFFDDAKTVSKELQITLTARSCGQQEKAPMCGVPYHAAEPYISKLVEKGYKIAICEQTQDANNSKGIVKREVVKLITPGTNQNIDTKNSDENNYLCTVVEFAKEYAIVFVDITTGTFKLTKINDANIILDEIKRMNPAEILYNDVLNINEIPIVSFCLKNNISCTELSNSYFDIEECKENIKKQFKLEFIQGLGLYSDLMILAVGSTIRYIYESQKGFLSNILGIEIYTLDSNMIIDGFTTRNLELVETMRDAKKQGSLFGVLDKTKTALGARYLRNSILSPSLDKALIIKRYDAIEDIKANLPLLDELREYLDGIYDLERIVSKLANGTVNPRDLLSLSQSFKCITPITSVLDKFSNKYIKDIREKVDNLQDLTDLIDSSISDDAGFSIRDGNIIKKGYNSQIDEYNEAQINGRNWILQLESQEKEKTGIKTLRVKYSKNFGYCIEVSKGQINQVPEYYIRRQTLTTGERYTFEELKVIENKIIGAQEKLYKLELEIFNEIKTTILNNIKRILSCAKLIAEIDFIQSLAYIANKYRYSRPEIVNDGRLEIEGGRHPVVELMINQNEFIANDVYLDMNKESFIIITGPNMSGKSTYMRQTALICIMAQIGSFVPCENCKLDLIDRVFTRVGASDDLATGQSTFMVEMTEVSNILHNATSRSLIILDEIGRGTSTFDGLSLAWSIVEYISDKTILGAKTLFATHYHELTELEGKLANVVNYYIDVYEKNDNVVFLRKILRGGANKSYGIQVAKLAGVPDKVIIRAKALAKELEKSDITQHITQVNTENRQITMFDICEFVEEKEDELRKSIIELDMDNMTPREALNFIYELKEKVDNGN